MVPTLRSANRRQHHELFGGGDCLKFQTGARSPVSTFASTPRLNTATLLPQVSASRNPGFRGAPEPAATVALCGPGAARIRTKGAVRPAPGVGLVPGPISQEPAISPRPKTAGAATRCIQPEIIISDGLIRK